MAADFSHLEETFFRAGEQLSEVPVYVEPERSWFHRLLQRDMWPPLVLEVALADDGDYASYELVHDEDYAELAA